MSDVERGQRVESAATAAATRFVAAHEQAATALGVELAEFLGDTDALARAALQGFTALADPEYVVGERLIAPGIGPILGVRLPLMSAVHRSFRRGTRRASSALLLDAMDRLLREELRELRWFGVWNLGRLLPTDPERTWQLLRRAARDADDWISVDTLAHPYGEGILLDGRRWAELEQLVYSPSRWERRLVGSTIATMPFIRSVPRSRGPAVAQRGLALVGELIGDAEPDVQKALSWALRSLFRVDPVAVTSFLETETDIAVATTDGLRAWVIRDALPKLPGEAAAQLRERLTGLRRGPGAPSTSRAARVASEFFATLPGATASGPAASAGHSPIGPTDRSAPAAAVRRTAP